LKFVIIENAFEIKGPCGGKFVSLVKSHRIAANLQTSKIKTRWHCFWKRKVCHFIKSYQPALSIHS